MFYDLYMEEHNTTLCRTLLGEDKHASGCSSDCNSNTFLKTHTHTYPSSWHGDWPRRPGKRILPSKGFLLLQQQKDNINPDVQLIGTQVQAWSCWLISRSASSEDFLPLTYNKMDLWPFNLDYFDFPFFITHQRAGLMTNKWVVRYFICSSGQKQTLILILYFSHISSFSVDSSEHFLYHDTSSCQFIRSMKLKISLISSPVINPIFTTDTMFSRLFCGHSWRLSHETCNVTLKCFWCDL